MRLLLGPLVLLLALLPTVAQQRNPLSKKPADPWARAFAGGGIELVLAADAAGGGYGGTLKVAESEFPVRARRAEDGLSGTFTVGADAFAFTCTLAGDALVLESDGERYELRATTPASSAEPGATPPAPAPGAAPLPELEGVHTGEVTPLQHPDGIFRCEMPKGWTVAGQTDEGMLVNPGLRETDTLEALVFVLYGELEERDRGLDVAQLLTQREPDLRADLEGQGIALEKAGRPARKVAVDERAGAEQTWRGRAENGSLTVWTGALVEREYYLAVVAIVMEGKDARYLPGAKRMFQSLVPKPPEPNPRVERGLAGASFGKSTSFGDGGSMTTTYEFRAGGSVLRRTLVSGYSLGDFGGGVGGDSESTGRYRAVGKLVYLQFRDGQEVARVEGPEERPSGLRFGEALYPRL